MKETDFIALQSFGSVAPLFSFSQDDIERRTSPTFYEEPPPSFDMRPYKGWRGRLLTLLGRLCARLAEKLEDWSRHLIRCQWCGQSQFYGEGCNPRWLDITRSNR